MVMLACSFGCGDNIAPIGPPLEHADTVFVVGHSDDDLIFMQPALIDALHGRGSVATIYVTTGDPVKGLEHAREPEQYWVLDSEGFLWNGVPPAPTGDMSYTHVRCLATADAQATSPACGDQLRATWQLISAAPRTP